MAEALTQRWICVVCGFAHDGPEAPEACPVCGAPPSEFEAEAPKTEAPAEASTAAVRWICAVCGYEHEGLEPPEACPACGAAAEFFEREDVPQEGDSGEGEVAPPLSDYLAQWARNGDDFETKFARVRDLAVNGRSGVSAMRTQRPFPDWDDVLFRGGQLYRMPLNEDAAVRTATVIGKTAKQPLELSMPCYVSHMSFGALSREAKTALARGSKRVGTAICSGEGGLLPIEREEAGAYIYELGTALFSRKDEAMQQADAVEIKIGQAAKPGLGGHLPKEKVTEEIAAVRGITLGQDSISPGRYTGLELPEDLQAEVARIHSVIGGKPVGIKITASHIEQDLEIALGAEPDFITIDCRGGGTGAAPVFVKDNVCLPPIFAIHRARKYLDSVNSAVTLCVTGGFRDSSDIAKALAMGADAVALATASLIAIGCQQYRVCHTGRCPVGITTQDPELRARFDIEASTQRFVNFYAATKEELAVLARINGRSDVHDLDLSDLVTLSHEIAQYTDIEHA